MDNLGDVGEALPQTNIMELPADLRSKIKQEVKLMYDQDIRNLRAERDRLFVEKEEARLDYQEAFDEDDSDLEETEAVYNTLFNELDNVKTELRQMKRVIRHKVRQLGEILRRHNEPPL